MHPVPVTSPRTEPEPPTGPTVEVSLTDLLDGVRTVLDAVRTRVGDTVTLTTDLYWVLPAGQVYDTSRVPDCAAATVGSLRDDASELRQLLDVDDEPVVWHDLAHLTGLLQRLAAQDLLKG